MIHSTIILLMLVFSNDEKKKVLFLMKRVTVMHGKNRGKKVVKKEAFKKSNI